MLATLGSQLHTFLGYKCQTSKKCSQTESKRKTLSRIQTLSRSSKKVWTSKYLPKNWYNPLAAELFSFQLEELETVGLHRGLTSLRATMETMKTVHPELVADPSLYYQLDCNHGSHTHEPKLIISNCIIFCKSKLWKLPPQKPCASQQQWGPPHLKMGQTCEPSSAVCLNRVLQDLSEKQSFNTSHSSAQPLIIL